MTRSGGTVRGRYAAPSSSAWSMPDKMKFDVIVAWGAAARALCRGPAASAALAGKTTDLQPALPSSNAPTQPWANMRVVDTSMFA